MIFKHLWILIHTRKNILNLRIYIVYGTISLLNILAALFILSSVSKLFFFINTHAHMCVLVHTDTHRKKAPYVIYMLVIHTHIRERAPYTIYILVMHTSIYL